MDKQSEIRIKKLVKDNKRLEEKITNAGFKGFGLGIVIGALLLLCILLVFGVYDKKLPYDENRLSKSYVVEYYPEYKDCEIEYYDCIKEDYGLVNPCVEGVNIYCQTNDNRNSLKEIEKRKLTKSLMFDGFTLDDVYEQRLKECIG